MRRPRANEACDSKSHRTWSLHVRHLVAVVGRDHVDQDALARCDRGKLDLVALARLKPEAGDAAHAALGLRGAGRSLIADLRGGAAVDLERTGRLRLEHDEALLPGLKAGDRVGDVRI